MNFIAVDLTLLGLFVIFIAIFLYRKRKKGRVRRQIKKVRKFECAFI